MEILRNLDAHAVLMLMFAAAMAGLLFGIAPKWRELQRAMLASPVHAVLRRRRVALEMRALRCAEVRCALCPVPFGCRDGGTPPADCPNRHLLD